MANPLLVTAYLATGLAGDTAPHLDSLLVKALCIFHPKAIPGYKVDRAIPAPPQAEIPIPILRRTLGPWSVPCCSDPILGHTASDRHEHFVKKIGVENAGLLAPESRLVVSTTNTWTKSHRQSLRTRTIDRVCWFAMGHRREVLKTLKRIKFLGKKISYGNGRVAKWTVEDAERDWTWFTPWDQYGTVLMRTLPIGPWLPGNLIGFRRNFGGVVDPYWHPERHTEIVVPC